MLSPAQSVSAPKDVSVINRPGERCTLTDVLFFVEDDIFFICLLRIPFDFEHICSRLLLIPLTLLVPALIIPSTTTATTMATIITVTTTMATITTVTTTIITIITVTH